MCAARAASGGRVDHKRQAKAVSQTLNHSNSGNWGSVFVSCGMRFDVNKRTRVDKSRKDFCPTCFSLSMARRTKLCRTKKSRSRSLIERLSGVLFGLTFGLRTFGKKASQRNSQEDNQTTD